jgi:hypothetical protein
MRVAPQERQRSGRPLPEAVRQKMEHAFRTNFSDIRIHEGPQASVLGADAYTQGTHIHFAPGAYQPSSVSGQHLLGHELAHVLQQQEGRVAVPPGQGAPVNADPGLEAEAEHVGAQAAMDERVTVQRRGGGQPVSQGVPAIQLNGKSKGRTLARKKQRQIKEYKTSYNRGFNIPSGEKNEGDVAPPEPFTTWREYAETVQQLKKDGLLQ